MFAAAKIRAKNPLSEGTDPPLVEALAACLTDYYADEVSGVLCLFYVHDRAGAGEYPLSNSPAG